MPSPKSERPPVKTGGFFFVWLCGAGALARYFWKRSKPSPPPSAILGNTPMESIDYTRTSSPAGPLLLALSSRGLMRLEFDRGQPAQGDNQTWQESASALGPWFRQLDEYFSGHRRSFSLPLDLRGT